MRAHLVEMTDAALVAAAQDGDRDAVGVLYARHAADLARYLRSIVRRTYGGDAAVDDIAQDTWEELLRGALAKYVDRGEDGPRFFTWLRSVARWQALRHFRRHRPELAAGEYVDAWAETAVFGATAGAEGELPAHLVALRAALAEAIDGLAPRQYQVVRARLDGLADDEIAAKLGLSAGQVSKAYENASRVLRQRLAGGPEPTPEGPAVAVPARRMCLPNGADPAAFRAAAQELPEASRRVALLKLEGRTNPAIAADLGLSVSTVCQSWQRACFAFARAGLMGTGAQPAHDGPVRLEAAVAQLSPAVRRVAELKLAGKPWPAMAAETGTTVNTVRATWQRARRALTAAGALTATPDAAPIAA